MIDIAKFPDSEQDVTPAETPTEQQAVFGAGCFWCVESVFRPLAGVRDVVPGYAGGTAATADYRSVCTGTTDHAEVIRIRFNPERISYGQLLKIFFSIAHDPTHVNRQGADVGRQYRSAVFYADDQQRQAAEQYIVQLNQSRIFPAPIATEVVPLREFFEAEAYHWNYTELHPDQPYIACHALPKVEKLRTYYASLLAGGSGQ